MAVKIYFGILLFIIATVIFFWGVQHNSSSSVCIDKKCFSVELAKTPAERERGLMQRKELDKNKGMLFIFNTDGIYSFWMKDTLIPLDMIWINSDNKIIYIAQGVQPCLPARAGETSACPLITPLAKAKYVLEVNAGISNAEGFKIGDEAKLASLN